jgi:hypothetical protein
MAGSASITSGITSERGFDDSVLAQTRIYFHFIAVQRECRGARCRLKNHSNAAPEPFFTSSNEQIPLSPL